MNPTAIYSKTGKGVQEATGKTSNLSRADRAILSAVDGKTNVGALYKKFDKTPEPKFHQLLERLDREGYIREASPGIAAQPTTRPSAPPVAKPMDAVSDLDFTGVFSPVRPSPASPSVPKPPPSVPKPPPSVPKPPPSVPKPPPPPPIDFAARARAEAEKRELEGAFDYKARQAAEAKAKAEAEARARDAASAPAKVEDDSRIRAEAEQKLKAAQEMALRVAAEEKARADKARAEAEAKAKAEEAERKRKEEEQRKQREEEEARRRKEEEERKRKEEEERKRREEEEARRRKEEEERKRREEEERRRKEEEERKRREEEARRRKEEEERKRREEEERRRKEEEERKRREEEARRRKQEEERRRKEEEERKRREEQEARRRKEEEARRRKEDDERRRREEEEARRRKEEEAAADLGGDSFADDLLADLDSFSQRGAGERKGREDSQRGAREAPESRRRAADSEPRRGLGPTSDGRSKRRLAAIVAADVVGYSRLMGIDEEGTLTRFKRIMREIVQPKVEEHSGTIVKTAGDGLLIEFPSVVDAVRFAVQVQTSVANEEVDIAPSRQIAFRMGVNLGDIISEDNDVYGDGVNVAARLEALADRGGICIAGVVFDQIRDKVTYSIEALGEQKLKNIPRPVRAYKIKGDWETTRLRRATDPGSMPRPSGRGLSTPPSEDDDIVVSDDDLNLDEVRLDEQALTKESRKAARSRAREEAKQLKAKRKAEKQAEKEAAKLAKQLAEKPVKIRRPRKWGKPVAAMLVLALVAGAGVVQFMPVDTAPFARAASAALGRKVVIGSAHYSLLGGFDLEFEGVRIGKVRIAKVRAYPELSTVLGQRKAFRRLELVDALVPQNELGNILLGALKPVGFTISKVEAKQITLPGPVDMPQVDIAADIGIDGGIASVKVTGRDNLNVTLRPKGAQVELDGTAGAFNPPFAPKVTLTEFSFKGKATRNGITLSEWDGSVLEGTLAGTARIVWGPTWSVTGTLKAKSMNAAVFAPALLSEGVGAGSGRFEMRGKVPSKLGARARIQGSFTVAKGVLGSFDLSRIIQTGGAHSEGRTRFASLEGNVAYDSGATALRDVNMSAGALTANAIANVAPDGGLSGRIVADIKTAGHVLRSTIVLGGTVKQPEVKK